MGFRTGFRECQAKLFRFNPAFIQMRGRTSSQLLTKNVLGCRRLLTQTPVSAWPNQAWTNKKNRGTIARAPVRSKVRLLERVPRPDLHYPGLSLDLDEVGPVRWGIQSA